MFFRETRFRWASVTSKCVFVRISDYKYANNPSARRFHFVCGRGVSKINGMRQINEEQQDLVRKYLGWFHNRITNELGGVLRNEVKHFVPPIEIAEVEEQVGRLQDAFSRRSIFDGLPDDLVPMFKRMIIDVRRTNVAEIESLKEKTHNPDLLQTLDEKLRPLNELMSQKWFREAKPSRIPLLIDYISLQRVEEINQSL